MKATLRLYALSAAAMTAIGAAGCSSSTTPPKTGKSQPETQKTAAPYPELLAANTQQKIQALADKCATINVELYPSSYGVWMKSKPCELPVTTTLSISIDGFHKNRQGDIDALLAITSNPDLVAILSGRYPGGSTASHGEVCVKFGRGGIPVLFIAALSRCDALTYSQI